MTLEVLKPVGKVNIMSKIKIPKKSGLLLSTYNNPSLRRPLSLVSSVIRFFTSGKYTHSAITIMLWGELYVIDSDTFGIIPRKFSDWKKNRAYILIQDPNVIKTEEEEKEYCKKLMSKSGIRYDFRSIYYQLNYQVDGTYEGEVDPEKAANNFICSEFFAWSYGLADWWKRSPINLVLNFYKDFPQGEYIGEGTPDEIEVG